MAYGLYLKMDQKRWFRGDFSTTNLLTGTLYTDVNQTTAKSLSGYTIKIRMHRAIHFGDFFNKTATIVSATAGTFSYAVESGQMPPRGIYYVKVEIAKTGDLESSINRIELQVLEGPSS